MAHPQDPQQPDPDLEWLRRYQAEQRRRQSPSPDSVVWNSGGEDEDVDDIEWLRRYQQQTTQEPEKPSTPGRQLGRAWNTVQDMSAQVLTNLAGAGTRIGAIPLKLIDAGLRADAGVHHRARGDEAAAKRAEELAKHPGPIGRAGDWLVEQGEDVMQSTPPETIPGMVAGVGTALGVDLLAFRQGAVGATGLLGQGARTASAANLPRSAKALAAAARGFRDVKGAKGKAGRFVHGVAMGLPADAGFSSLGPEYTGVGQLAQLGEMVGEEAVTAPKAGLSDEGTGAGWLPNFITHDWFQDAVKDPVKRAALETAMVGGTAEALFGLGRSGFRGAKRGVQKAGARHEARAAEIDESLPLPADRGSVLEPPTGRVPDDPEEAALEDARRGLEETLEGVKDLPEADPAYLALLDDWRTAWLAHENALEAGDQKSAMALASRLKQLNKALAEFDSDTGARRSVVHHQPPPAEPEPVVPEAAPAGEAEMIPPDGPGREVEGWRSDEFPQGEGVIEEPNESGLETLQTRKPLSEMSIKEKRRVYAHLRSRLRDAQEKLSRAKERHARLGLTRRVEGLTRDMQRVLESAQVKDAPATPAAKPAAERPKEPTREYPLYTEDGTAVYKTKHGNWRAHVDGPDKPAKRVNATHARRLQRRLEQGRLHDGTEQARRDYSARIEAQGRPVEDTQPEPAPGVVEKKAPEGVPTRIEDMPEAIEVGPAAPVAEGKPRRTVDETVRRPLGKVGSKKQPFRSKKGVPIYRAEVVWRYYDKDLAAKGRDPWRNMGKEVSARYDEAYQRGEFDEQIRQAGAKRPMPPRPEDAPVRPRTDDESMGTPLTIEEQVLTPSGRPRRVTHGGPGMPEEVRTRATQPEPRSDEAPPPEAPAGRALGTRREPVSLGEGRRGFRRPDGTWMVDTGTKRGYEEVTDPKINKALDELADREARVDQPAPPEEAPRAAPKREPAPAAEPVVGTQRNPYRVALPEGRSFGSIKNGTEVFQSKSGAWWLRNAPHEKWQGANKPQSEFLDRQKGEGALVEPRVVRPRPRRDFSKQGEGAGPVRLTPEPRVEPEDRTVTPEELEEFKRTGVGGRAGEAVNTTGEQFNSQADQYAKARGYDETSIRYNHYVEGFKDARTGRGAAKVDRRWQKDYNQGRKDGFAVAQGKAPDAAPKKAKPKREKKAKPVDPNDPFQPGAQVARGKHVRGVIVEEVVTPESKAAGKRAFEVTTRSGHTRVYTEDQLRVIKPPQGAASPEMVHLLGRAALGGVLGPVLAPEDSTPVDRLIAALTGALGLALGPQAIRALRRGQVPKEVQEQAAEVFQSAVRRRKDGRVFAEFSGAEIQRLIAKFEADPEAREVVDRLRSELAQRRAADQANISDLANEDVLRLFGRLADAAGPASPPVDRPDWMPEKNFDGSAVGHKAGAVIEEFIGHVRLLDEASQVKLAERLREAAEDEGLSEGVRAAAKEAVNRLSYGYGLGRAMSAGDHFTRWRSAIRFLTRNKDVPQIDADWELRALARDFDQLSEPAQKTILGKMDNLRRELHRKGRPMAAMRVRAAREDFAAGRAEVVIDRVTHDFYANSFAREVAEGKPDFFYRKDDPESVGKAVAKTIELAVKVAKNASDEAKALLSKDLLSLVAKWRNNGYPSHAAFLEDVLTDADDALARTLREAGIDPIPREPDIGRQVRDQKAQNEAFHDDAPTPKVPDAWQEETLSSIRRGEVNLRHLEAELRLDLEEGNFDDVDLVEFWTRARDLLRASDDPGYRQLADLVHRALFDGDLPPSRFDLPADDPTNAIDSVRRILDNAKGRPLTDIERRQVGLAMESLDPESAEYTEIVRMLDDFRREITPRPWDTDGEFEDTVRGPDVEGDEWKQGLDAEEISEAEALRELDAAAAHFSDDAIKHGRPTRPLAPEVFDRIVKALENDWISPNDEFVKHIKMLGDNAEELISRDPSGSQNAWLTDYVSLRDKVKSWETRPTTPDALIREAGGKPDDRPASEFVKEEKKVTEEYILKGKKAPEEYHRFVSSVFVRGNDAERSLIRKKIQTQITLAKQKGNKEAVKELTELRNWLDEDGQKLGAFVPMGPAMFTAASAAFQDVDPESADEGGRVLPLGVAVSVGLLGAAFLPPASRRAMSDMMSRAVKKDPTFVLERIHGIGAAFREAFGSAWTQRGRTTGGGGGADPGREVPVMEHYLGRGEIGRSAAELEEKLDAFLGDLHKDIGAKRAVRTAVTELFEGKNPFATRRQRKEARRRIHMMTEALGGIDFQGNPIYGALKRGRRETLPEAVQRAILEGRNVEFSSKVEEEATVGYAKIDGGKEIRLPEVYEWATSANGKFTYTPSYAKKMWDSVPDGEKQLIIRMIRPEHAAWQLRANQVYRKLLETRKLAEGVAGALKETKALKHMSGRRKSQEIHRLQDKLETLRSTINNRVEQWNYLKLMAQQAEGRGIRQAKVVDELPGLDEFNREHMRILHAELDSNIEGWLHHTGFENEHAVEEFLNRLAPSVASVKRFRKGAPGWQEDVAHALHEAAWGLRAEKIMNRLGEYIEDAVSVKPVGDAKQPPRGMIAYTRLHGPNKGEQVWMPVRVARDYVHDFERWTSEMGDKLTNQAIEFLTDHSRSLMRMWTKNQLVSSQSVVNNMSGLNLMLLRPMGDFYRAVTHLAPWQLNTAEAKKNLIRAMRPAAAMLQYFPEFVHRGFWLDLLMDVKPGRDVKGVRGMNFLPRTGLGASVGAVGGGVLGPGFGGDPDEEIDAMIARGEITEQDREAARNSIIRRRRAKGALTGGLLGAGGGQIGAMKTVHGLKPHDFGELFTQQYRVRGETEPKATIPGGMAAGGGIGGLIGAYTAEDGEGWEGFARGAAWGGGLGAGFGMIKGLQGVHKGLDMALSPFHEADVYMKRVQASVERLRAAEDATDAMIKAGDLPASKRDESIAELVDINYVPLFDRRKEASELVGALQKQRDRAMKAHDRKGTSEKQKAVLRAQIDALSEALKRAEGDLGTETKRERTLYQVARDEMWNRSLYAPDYSLAPAGLNRWQRSAIGMGFSPYLKWKYFYGRGLYHHTIKPAFDRDLPLRERIVAIASFLTLTAPFYNWQIETEQESTAKVVKRREAKDGLTYQIDRSGRQNISEVPVLGPALHRNFGIGRGTELQQRTVKYPFADIGQAAGSLATGQTENAAEALWEGISTGPLVDAIGLALGRPDRYRQFDSPEARLGDFVRSFVPFHRLIEDAGTVRYPAAIQPETFKQGSYGPLAKPFKGGEGGITASENLYGKHRVDRSRPLGISAPGLGKELPDEPFYEPIHRDRTLAALALILGINLKEIDKNMAARELGEFKQKEPIRDIKDMRDRQMIQPWYRDRVMDLIRAREERKKRRLP